MTARVLARVAALVIALAPVAARPDPAPRPLRYDLRVDGALVIGTWGAWGAAELAKERWGPATCRWCASNGLDAGARELLAWGAHDRASRTSNAVLALVPVGVVTHQLLAARASGDTTAGLVDVVLVLEAAGVAMDLNQLAKAAFGRQRPLAQDGAEGRTPEADDNLSFDSAHATLAFSLAAAAGTVSSLRGYRTAPWVWAVGMSLAALTAYLRVAADEHYLTDVLAGAAVGTAMGIAIPRLLHGRERQDTDEPVAVVAFPLGVRIAF